MSPSRCPFKVPCIVRPNGHYFWQRLKLAECELIQHWQSMTAPCFYVFAKNLVLSGKFDLLLLNSTTTTGLFREHPDD